MVLQFSSPVECDPTACYHRSSAANTASATLYSHRVIRGSAQACFTAPSDVRSHAPRTLDGDRSVVIQRSSSFTGDSGSCKACKDSSTFCMRKFKPC